MLSYFIPLRRVVGLCLTLALMLAGLMSASAPASSAMPCHAGMLHHAQLELCKERCLAAAQTHDVDCVVGTRDTVTDKNKAAALAITPPMATQTASHNRPTLDRRRWCGVAPPYLLYGRLLI